jgi:D-sedoheptulose 7-phosphate isomerase
MAALSDIVQSVLDGLLARRPDLAGSADDLVRLHQALVTCYDQGGKLMTCGNGGSHADAIHITGELCKSFERRRPVPADVAGRLRALPHGEDLAAHLEAGLAAIPIGVNGALKTAVENDCPLRDIAFAQEVFALARPGDVLLALSTSGNAVNCLMAMSAAKASGVYTVSLTGPGGGRMAGAADLALRAPGGSTKEVQESHLALYHTFCAMIEAHYFPEPRC